MKGESKGGRKRERGKGSARALRDDGGRLMPPPIPARLPKGKNELSETRQ